jgi:16S rRNA (cytosine967-C5)-methyltransferase
VSFEKFLTSVLYYAERGYPLPVAFKRAKEKHKVRANYDELYEKSRLLILSYFSLNGKKRSQKVRQFLYASSRPVFPEWMREELSKYLDVDALERSLPNKFTWFRVNALKADEDKVLKRLAERGIEFERDKDFPFIYRLLKGDLTKTEEFNKYEVVIQDKASVAVVMALNPSREEIVIDLASAPGIKAELIAELTDNKAKMILSDIDIGRLEKERFLLKKFGVNMDKVEFVRQDSSYLPELRADKVLLDAPCSSSGMINNEPSILLTLKDNRKVKHYAELQRGILREALKIKAKEMVYAVCSLFYEEGEAHFEKIGHATERPLNVGSNGYSPRVSSVRFFSSVHFTESFFITKVKLEKLR